MSIQLMTSEKYFAVLQWVIRPEHRFHSGIDHTSSVHPSPSSASPCLRKRCQNLPKPYSSSEAGEESTGILQRGGSHYFIFNLYFTATNDKAHQAYLMPSKSVESRFENKPELRDISQNDQRIHFQSTCSRSHLHPRLYALIKLSLGEQLYQHSAH